jgi:hypothetical protein
MGTAEKKPKSRRQRRLLGEQMRAKAYCRFEIVGPGHERSANPQPANYTTLHEVAVINPAAAPSRAIVAGRHWHEVLGWDDLDVAPLDPCGTHDRGGGVERDSFRPGEMRGHRDSGIRFPLARLNGDCTVENQRVRQRRPLPNRPIDLHAEGPVRRLLVSDHEITAARIGVTRRSGRFNVDAQEPTLSRNSAKSQLSKTATRPSHIDGCLDRIAIEKCLRPIQSPGYGRLLRSCRRAHVIACVIWSRMARLSSSPTLSSRLSTTPTLNNTEHSQQKNPADHRSDAAGPEQRRGRGFVGG